MLKQEKKQTVDLNELSR